MNAYKLGQQLKAKEAECDRLKAQLKSARNEELLHEVRRLGIDLSWSQKYAKDMADERDEAIKEVNRLNCEINAMVKGK